MIPDPLTGRPKVDVLEPPRNVYSRAQFFNEFRYSNKLSVLDKPLIVKYVKFQQSQSSACTTLQHFTLFAYCFVPLTNFQPASPALPAVLDVGHSYACLEIAWSCVGLCVDQTDEHCKNG